MPDGGWLQDEVHLERIRRLAIPPAYRKVWICRWPDGHLQATGRDARGRKQYRYHPDWHAQRDAEKFERMAAFGQCLPLIRARVNRDLAQFRSGQPVSRTIVLAAIVRLLDDTLVRVGNEEYRRLNGSHGLTTLRDEHATLKAGRLHLNFPGKSGVVHEISLDDARLARIVRRCQSFPGHELFQYQDHDGTLRPVRSDDVNAYLRDLAGSEFSAKDFRTWHATVHALNLSCEACFEASPCKQTMVRILADVARRLGNTPAVCRKSYVHPMVLDLGSLMASDPARARRIAGRIERSGQRAADGAHDGRHFSDAERCLLAFLRSSARSAA